MEKQMYKNVCGLWTVTTEGDCEGRSTKQLGTFEGYVDEIALFLANKAYYSLQFKLQKKIKKYYPTCKSVDVSFDIDSGTWDLKPKERINLMKDFFSDRPVYIEEGQYFACVKIRTTENLKHKEKEKALGKLTDYEKQLLGLNN